MALSRVYREDGRWAVLPPSEFLSVYYDEFEDMPEPLRTNLAILLPCALDTSLPGIGRRISDDIFWVHGD
jgi:hypothetical protein